MDGTVTNTYQVENDYFQYLELLDNPVTLSEIHYDLQVILCFIGFFTVLIVCKLILKLLNMFF